MSVLCRYPGYMGGKIQKFSEPTFALQRLQWGRKIRDSTLDGDERAEQAILQIEAKPPGLFEIFCNITAIIVRE